MRTSFLGLRGRRLDGRPSRGAHSWGRYLLRVPVVLALSLLPALTVGGVTASAQEGTYIVVSPGPGMGGFVDTIEGGGWPEGDTVTLQIFDPANGPGVAYTATTVTKPLTIGPYDFGFNLEGTFDVRAGQTVTVSDAPNGGTITKTTTVTGLTETSVDPGTNTVIGTAAPGSTVLVLVFDATATRNVQADDSGNWIADFSVPGNSVPGNPGDVTYNITGGMAVGATQFDADGNQTAAALLPPTGMTVSPNMSLSDGQQVSVSGFGLTPGWSYVLEQGVHVPGAGFHDTSYQVPLTLDAKGDFGSTDFVVHRNISVTTPSGANPVDCSQEGCYVVVVGGPDLNIEQLTVFIGFAGMTVSPNMSLSEGQNVSVSGFGLTPDVPYVLEQCVQGQFWHSCDTSHQVPLMLDAKGNFGSTDFVVHKNITVPGPGGTIPVDCINGGYEGCDVAVIGGDYSGFPGSLTVFIDFVTPPCGALQSCGSAFSPSPDGSLTVTSPDVSGPVTASATGGGGITVGRYAADPVSPPTFLASAGYFDVKVSNSNSFTNVTIVNCALQGGTSAQWWNPASGATGAWQPVSNQSYSPGPPACLTITVNATTSPSLAQLTGTVFAAQIMPPVITSTSLPASGTVVPVNTPTPTLSTSFSDGGSGTHTCTTNWGDGTLNTVAASPDGATGTCAMQHSYGIDGVYNVTTTVTNPTGATSLSATVQIVVYDPSAGFVTGGGWITSPAGAYPANPSLTGPATFGFVSKYQKGAAVPTGQTDFQFHTAGFTFHSDAYQWMVVAGAKAQYKGTGSVNKVPGYGFMLTALDGNLLNNRAIDGFRIKIITPDGTIFYDNVPGATDNAGAMPLTPLGGGEIVIHKS